jgi:predicted DNA-binding transcriptional regulator AlpA
MERSMNATPDTPDTKPNRRERRAAAASGINIFDGYITRDELAQMLGRDVRTIERWEQERRGPPRTKVGNLIRYRLQAVREWLAANEAKQVRAGGR